MNKDIPSELKELLDIRQTYLDTTSKEEIVHSTLRHMEFNIIYWVSIRPSNFNHIVNLIFDFNEKERTIFWLGSHIPDFLKYTDNQTDELIEISINKNPKSYIHVRDLTKEIYLKAIKRVSTIYKDKIRVKLDLTIKEVLSVNSTVMKYIKYPTEEECYAAIEQNPLSIQFIEDPIYNLCKLAVEKHPLAIKHIKAQIFDLCYLAVSKNYSVNEWIRDERMREEVIKKVKYVRENKIVSFRLLGDDDFDIVTTLKGNDLIHKEINDCNIDCLVVSCSNWNEVLTGILEIGRLYDKSYKMFYILNKSILDSTSTELGDKIKFVDNVDELVKAINDYNT